MPDIVFKLFRFINRGVTPEWRHGWATSHGRRRPFFAASLSQFAQEVVFMDIFRAKRPWNLFIYILKIFLVMEASWASVLVPL
jgi:hypothetical protein